MRQATGSGSPPAKTRTISRRGMIRFRMGAAMKVVTSVITTIIAKIRSDNTPRVRPTVRITSSVRPRVFISVPRARESRVE